MVHDAIILRHYFNTILQYTDSVLRRGLLLYCGYPIGSRYLEVKRKFATSIRLRCHQKMALLSSILVTDVGKSPNINCCVCEDSSLKKANSVNLEKFAPIYYFVDSMTKVFESLH